MDENPYESPQTEPLLNSSNLTPGRIFVLMFVAAAWAFIAVLGYELVAGKNDRPPEIIPRVTIPAPR